MNILIVITILFFIGTIFNLLIVFAYSNLMKEIIKKDKIIRSYENIEIRKIAEKKLCNPQMWLETPHSDLGNRRPIDVLETCENYKVRDILTAF